MSVKLKIKVTKEILERSKYCGDDAEPVIKNCAIALAVRDIFPYAVVTPFYIRPFATEKASVHEQNIKIMLPQNATSFITKFDNLCSSPEERLLLPEFEFEIDISQEIIDTINIDEVKELLINHPTLELV